MHRSGPVEAAVEADCGLGATSTADASAAGPLRVCSLELSANSAEAIARAAGLLPPETLVYVPKLPKRSHLDGLAQVRLARESGLRPIPHVAARSLASRQELESFLRAASGDCGVDRVLVIGGDEEKAAGPFVDSAAVIASGILEASGIRRVDVAGYPDGHPRIAPDILRRDLAAKIELAATKGLSLTVLTQFSFSPERIADYCAGLARVSPGTPVHAGVVGPTSAKRLLQFARICGVATSLRAVEKFGLDALRLVMQADTGRQCDELARRHAAGAAGNLAGVHVFTFGGFVESAAWAAGHGRERTPGGTA